jgi:hypothetical protein
MVAPGYRVNEMKRFVQGDSRTQSILLPESLDDYVTDTNPVRVIDVFVDELDLGQLGFDGVEPADTGRPSYHPEVMLKIRVGFLPPTDMRSSTVDLIRGASFSRQRDSGSTLGFRFGCGP